MLGLTVSSDYTRFDVSERMIYLFHEEDPFYDGLIVLNSYPDYKNQVQMKLIGFAGMRTYRKTLLWGTFEIYNSIILNKDVTPEHEPLAIIFRNLEGDFVGKIVIKLLSNGAHHRIKFEGFKEIKIFRKAALDKLEDKEVYQERLNRLVDNFLSKEDL